MLAVCGDVAVHSDAAMNAAAAVHGDAAAHNNAEMQMNAAVHDKASVHMDAAVLSDTGSTMHGCSTNSPAQPMAEAGELWASWGQSGGLEPFPVASSPPSTQSPVLSAAWAEQLCKGSCSSFAIYGLYSSTIGFRWCPVIKVACVGSQET